MPHSDRQNTKARSASTITPHTAVFEARGLTKVYRMGEIEVHALRGVDLDLYQGEFVVLLGPSGSGKSTLLNILGGLDVPTLGRVHYRDHDLTAYDDVKLTRYRRDHVGFVFQFYNLIPSLTARENVAPVKRRTLEDGYRVEARIVVWEGEDVLKVPAGALFRHANDWAVFVADNGRARLRSLSVGKSNGQEAEVLDGLQVGDEVILHPSDRIKNGIGITPRTPRN